MKHTVRGRLARWIVGTAVLLCATSPAGADAPGSKGGYQISGTVVSTRDGAPVPSCTITATVAAAGPGSVRVRDMPAAPRDPVRPGRGGPVPGPGPGLGQGPGSIRGGRAARPGGVTQNQRPMDGNPETRSDASGRFSLSLPHGGSWRVTAAARGFRSQDYQEHEGYYSSIVLTEQAPAYEAKLVLVPDSLISGFVLDEAGEAVGSAQIVAEVMPPLVPGESRTSASGQPRFVENAQSDDRGHYELPFLAPGEYRLRVQAQPWYANVAQGGPRMGAPLVVTAGGSGGRVATQQSAPINLDPSLDVVYPVTWYPASDSQAAAETIRLAGGEEREADFHLTAVPASHLVVARPDTGQPEPGGGRPRPQRPVTITRVSSDGSFGQTSFIGGNERDWDFGGLAPGIYEVRLPGPHGERDGETRQIEVRPGGGGLVTLENSRPLTRVTISVDGLPDSESISVEFIDVETGRRIVASPPLGGRRGRSGDDTDGGEDGVPAPMSLMLPPHRYEVLASGRNGVYVSGLSGTGLKVLGRTLEIGEGSAAAVTVHVADARAELSGIASVDGNPVCGAMVMLVPVTLGQPGEVASLLRDQTNSDGSFVFEAVVPGRYILVAIAQGWSVNFRDPATLTRYLGLGVPVEMKGSDKLRKEIAAVLR